MSWGSLAWWRWVAVLSIVLLVFMTHVVEGFISSSCTMNYNTVNYWRSSLGTLTSITSEVTEGVQVAPNSDAMREIDFDEVSLWFSVF